MATGKKTGNTSGLKPFKKGQSGNPGGRKPLPDEIKALSYATKPQIISLYYNAAHMTPAQVSRHKPANLVEQGILKCLSEFAKTGKTDQIRHIWAECHGKPKETIDANIRTDNTELEEAVQMADEFVRRNNEG